MPIAFVISFTQSAALYILKWQNNASIHFWAIITSLGKIALSKVCKDNKCGTEFNYKSMLGIRIHMFKNIQGVFED